MALDTIFQHWIFKDFMLPFVFMFVLIFAILQKTGILGKDKKQLDAIVAFVISLIFVSVAYPKLVVGNLILVLTVALVVIFIGLLLWGFLIGGEAKFSFDAKWMKWVVGIGVTVFVILAVIWASGFNSDVLNFLFYQSWSSVFWTNFIFIAVIIILLIIIIKSGGGKSE
jgi:hypothetical protein